MFIVYVGYRSGTVPVTSFVILILLFSRIFPQFIALNTDMNMIVSNVASVRLVLQLDEDLEAGGENEQKERVSFKVRRRSG